MPGFEIEELTRLAELYTQAESTNPLLVLRQNKALTTADRRLLETIIASSPEERLAAWKQELQPNAQAQPHTPGTPLSKEEYLNVAKRDFEHSQKNSVLQFVLNERTKK